MLIRFRSRSEKRTKCLPLEADIGKKNLHMMPTHIIIAVSVIGVYSYYMLFVKIVVVLAKR